MAAPEAAAAARRAKHRRDAKGKKRKLEEIYIEFHRFALICLDLPLDSLDLPSKGHGRGFLVTARGQEMIQNTKGGRGKRKVKQSESLIS